MLNKKKLEEKVVVGGGATGQSSVPDPIIAGDVHAKRPQDNKKGADQIDTSGSGGEETPTENNVKATKGNEANRATIKTKPSAASDANVREEETPSYDSAELFEAFGMADITEEFKTKISTIFEAAVSIEADAKAAIAIAEAEEQAAADLADLNESIDKYLSYAAAEWLKENQVAVEHALRSEITETFMTGLKKLFAENYMEIPEDKVDLVAEMKKEIDDLTSALNEKTEEVIQLSTVVTESIKTEIVAEAAQGLAETQVAKLATLVESVEFVDADDFKNKVAILKESFVTKSKPVKESTLITEDSDDVQTTEVPNIKGPMAGYMAAISRTSKI